MKKLKSIIISMVIVLTLGIAFAQKDGELHKKFKAKSNLDISLVSGDCIIKTGSSDVIKVDVIFDVRPSDSFEPIIKESGRTLKIKERWHGSSSGDVVWTITVPPNTSVDFSSASGDLSVEGLIESLEGRTASGDITVIDSKGDFELKTASGDIEAEDIQGEFEIKAASGDIDIKNASGSFEISCASGDIKASDIIITEDASFSAASGDIDIRLKKTASADLEISAASGDVSLDYQGNPVKGLFEFSSRKHKGRIRSDISFDSEVDFERNGREYVKKTFTKGTKSRVVLLRTASGNITFKK